MHKNTPKISGPLKSNP